MQSEDESPRQPAAEPMAALLGELAQLSRAATHMFGAQMHLFAAELGLARSAVSWLLLAGLAATVAAVGMGLTLLTMIALLLAHWLDSWLWALLAVFVLQGVFLLAAIVLFRRCMHWMSLPATRGEMSAMMHEVTGPPDAEAAATPKDRA